MRLSGLLDILASSPNFDQLLELLATRPAIGVSDAAKAYVLAAVAQRTNRPVVVVTPRAQRARELVAQLAAWAGPQAEVLLYPEIDAVPFERTGPDSYTLHQRLTALAALTAAGGGSTGRVPIVVAGVPAALQKTLPPARFAAAGEVWRPGERLRRDPALARWLRLGYRHVPSVETPGTVAHRGGIVDIFPPNSEFPARIELWGDTIDNIRWFDPQSQRSATLAEALPIIPAREFVLPEHDSHPAMPHLTLSELEPEVRERFQRELGLLAEGQPFEGMDFYSPLFPFASLLDYLPSGTLVVVDEPEDCAAVSDELLAQVEEIRRSHVSRGLLPPEFPLPCYAWEDLSARAGDHDGLLLQRWAQGHPGDAVSPVPQSLTRRRGKGRVGAQVVAAPDTAVTALRLPLRPVPAYGGQLRLALREVRRLVQQGSRVAVLSHQAARLAELLQDEDLTVQPVEEVLATPEPGALTLVHGSIGSGWALVSDPSPDHQGPALHHPSLVLLTDAELFGFAKEPARSVRRRTALHRDNPLPALHPGDYVVHVDHGIARFGGMARTTQDEAPRDYLVLDYAEGDRLYVPVDQVNRVGRYVGPAGRSPTLSRLGTAEWTRAKERVQKATAALARELLATQATRQLLPGHAFAYDEPWQQELEASFPYVETPDQLEVLREVKEDMERPRPMDRLVCGDVGYGKTEVALRAAFKAVMDGRQVAVLVPTTVLAQQHYATFTQRLAPFPAKVEVLSRFRSDREQHEVVAGLRDGRVDICIGTHRLLQKDVAFKNLGLVIVDEEQRFGVLHKEHLKRLREGVDLLTLTATPIPRTLYLALVGARDLSTIDTPPDERLAVRTYVLEYNERIIREAILREIERDGQVFFVHNRVQSIAEMYVRLSSLVPEARFCIGHGQMGEDELEQVMADFAAGTYDVLICTTIIESGLDLPNVNTMIVNRADRFGLSQLYQLRGRVGRGVHRAYAYLLFERSRALTETVQKRLQAIFEATELGAGFQIALKDLEIRGAGNLLGPEQSGYIGTVGFDLYCRLLADAVERLKAEQEGRTPEAAAPTPPPPTIDLPLAAHLPDDYVDDLSTRLDLYRRMAEATTEEAVEDLAQEVHDRFGRMPSPARTLLWVAKLRVLASRAGVRSIALEDGQAVVRLHDGLSIDRRAMAGLNSPLVAMGNTQLRVDTRRPGAPWQQIMERALEALAGAPVAG